MCNAGYSEFTHGSLNNLADQVTASFLVIKTFTLEERYFFKAEVSTLQKVTSQYLKVIEPIYLDNQRLTYINYTIDELLTGLFIRYPQPPSIVTDLPHTPQGEVVLLSGKGATLWQCPGVVVSALWCLSALLPVGVTGTVLSIDGNGSLCPH